MVRAVCYSAKTPIFVCSLALWPAADRAALLRSGRDGDVAQSDRLPEAGESKNARRPSGRPGVDHDACAARGADDPGRRRETWPTRTTLPPQHNIKISERGDGVAASVKSSRWHVKGRRPSSPRAAAARARCRTRPSRRRRHRASRRWPTPGPCPRRARGRGPRRLSRAAARARRRRPTARQHAPKGCAVCLDRRVERRVLRLRLVYAHRSIDAAYFYVSWADGYRMSCAYAAREEPYEAWLHQIGANRCRPDDHCVFNVLLLVSCCALWGLASGKTLAIKSAKLDIFVY